MVIGKFLGGLIRLSTAALRVLRSRPLGSIPDRRPATLRARARRSSFVVCALALAGVGFEPQSARAQSLDWNAAGSPVNSFELVDDVLSFTAQNTCDGSTVTATFSDPDGAARPDRSFPDNRNENTGSSQALMWLDGAACNDEGVELDLDFGGAPVENLAFSFSDIDQGGTWIDEIVISAEFAGPEPATLSCGDGATPPNCTTFFIDDANNTATGTFNNNPFDDAAGRVDVVVAGPVQRMTIRYQAADDCSLTGAQVMALSGFTFDCSLLPVTLASFAARPTEDGVDLDWTTASETGNVGFHLYGERDGVWNRLNARLVPSRSFDSLSPQSYTFRIPLGGADRFKLAEVDRRGNEKLHGPFEPGVSAGSPITAQPVDWSAVRTAEHSHSRVGSPVAELGEDEARLLDLHVAEDGLYRVSYEDLVTAGFDLAGVASDRLALTERGVAVPVRVVSAPGQGGGALFGPGDSLEFLGRALDTLYTTTNVYRLAVEPELAEPVLSVTPEVRGDVVRTHFDTRRFEEDRAYSFASPNGDPWFDRALLAFDEAVSESFEFEIDALVADAVAPELTVEMWGVTDWPTVSPDHHVTVALNGTEVHDVTFDGLADATFTVSLPAGLLVEGDNTLTITLPADTDAEFDLVHFEAFSVAYSRRLEARDDRLSFEGRGESFEVDGFTSSGVTVYAQTEQGVLRRIDNVEVESSEAGYKAIFAGRADRTLSFEVSADSALLKPAAILAAAPRDGLVAGRADYLILTHAAFEGALSELVSARQADGYVVRTVDVADVFSRYSGGVFDPQAIRDYIADAVAEMGVEYVLLVGGDTYDYHDVLGVGSVSFVPTIYAATHPVVRFSPADSLLADIDGDGVQDVAIGRLPVRTVDELATVIDKTLSYSPAERTSVFAADAADALNSFSEISDSFVAALGAGWSATPAYVDALGLDGARELLTDSFDAGASLVNYVGHSSAMSWTFGNLFTSAEALALTNVDRPAIVLQWGCWNGYHSVPEYDTLGHSLLLGGPVGAAAVVGASTLTEVYADEALALEFYPRLVEPGQTLGRAMLEAKQTLAARSGGYDDVIYGMTILGDPALVVEP